MLKNKKHIVIARLFDSGGMNTHFRTLIHYLGAEKVILILEDQHQLEHFNGLGLKNVLGVYVRRGLHPFAHLAYRWSTNIRESLSVLRSLGRVFWLSLINGFADVTISVAEPEKYLYLFWLPFIRVVYILHSEPKVLMSGFTRTTCNRRLGPRRPIVTVSRSMKKAICSTWQLTSRRQPFVNVVHNCLLQDAAVLEKSAGENDKLRITTMGHVDDRKNPATWLAVAQVITSRVRETEFFWLGNGALLESYRELARDSKNISFIGKVDQVGDWLAQTAVYYQPSLTEPHGIAAVEAMAAGLPCVVSNAGGLPESVADGENGFVLAPDDVSGQVAAIERLLSDVLLRREFGMNSLERYHRLFTYPIFRKKMNRIYETGA